MNLFYCWIYWGQPDWFIYLPHPVFPIAISVMYMAALYHLQEHQGKWLTFENIMIFYSTYFMLLGFLILLQWPNNQVWYDHYVSKKIWDGLNLIEIPIVLGLTLLCTLIFSGGAFLLRKKLPSLKPFYFGPNVLLLFGHFLDASATYRAIDFHNYSEKHVLPDLFIEAFDTAIVMFPIKAIILIAVIWLLDIYLMKRLPEDLEERENTILLFGLVKVMILMVGLAPGLRDIFRLAMGI